MMATKQTFKEKGQKKNFSDASDWQRSQNGECACLCQWSAETEMAYTHRCVCEGVCEAVWVLGACLISTCRGHKNKNTKAQHGELTVSVCIKWNGHFDSQLTARLWLCIWMEIHMYVKMCMHVCVWVRFFLCVCVVPYSINLILFMLTIAVTNTHVSIPTENKGPWLETHSLSAMLIVLQILFCPPPPCTHTHTRNTTKITHSGRRAHSNNAIYWQLKLTMTIVDFPFLAVCCPCLFILFAGLFFCCATHACHGRVCLCPFSSVVLLNLFNLYLLWSKWQFIVICIYSRLNTHPFQAFSASIFLFRGIFPE